MRAGMLPQSAFAIFAILLAASAIFNAFRQQYLVGFPELVLVVAILFCGYGERITKMAISLKDGLLIEQRSVDQQVASIAQESQAIERFIEQDVPGSSVVDIIERESGRPRDVWSKLILIRMTLRKLLRALAKPVSLSYEPTASIRRMSSDLLRRGTIDERLADDVERIRNATFVAEWGAGEQATIADVEFALRNYGTVFERLKERGLRRAQ